MDQNRDIRWVYYRRETLSRIVKYKTKHFQKTVSITGLLATKWQRCSLHSRKVNVFILQNLYLYAKSIDKLLYHSKSRSSTFHMTVSLLRVSITVLYVWFSLLLQMSCRSCTLFLQACCSRKERMWNRTSLAYTVIGSSLSILEQQSDDPCASCHINITSVAIDSDVRCAYLGKSHRIAEKPVFIKNGFFWGGYCIGRMATIVGCHINSKAYRMWFGSRGGWDEAHEKKMADSRRGMRRK